jgi:transcriptional regulator with XRE-family HTH domain
MPRRTDLRLTFGNRVRQLRLERGWSQEVLAEMANMHRTYISQVERGLRNPGLINLGELAHAFGVHLQELFAGVD